MTATATTEDAQATAAFNAEFSADDFPKPGTPGGDTDALWVYLAHEFAPTHLTTTYRRGWEEGFVAALELARGTDAPAGVESVLKDSLDRGNEQA